jgi:hypothetical protein
VVVLGGVVAEVAVVEIDGDGVTVGVERPIDSAQMYCAKLSGYACDDDVGRVNVVSCPVLPW